MEKFIELIEDVYKERFNFVINELITTKIPLTFLSIGDFEIVVNNVKNLRKQNLNITNLITTSKALPEYVTDLDFKVTNLEKVSEIYPRPEFVLTADTTDARVAIKNFPTAKVLSVEKNNSEKAYSAFMSNLSNLKRVYESLIDEESRRTFRGYWLGNISNQLSKIVHSNNPHYLTPGFIPKKNSIVIDAGSFDGGTPTRFVERGFKVYGFEMDKRMFQIAKKVGEQKDFVMENMGLGSYKHTMKYLPLDSESTHLDEKGTESAVVTTVDSYVREKNLPSVDFIKLDVEGAEL